MDVHGNGLAECLAFVDGVAVDGGASCSFIIIGAQKAFSITRTPFGCFHFDSHQRTTSGTVGVHDTCVVQASEKASDLFGSLSLGESPPYPADADYQIYCAILDCKADPPIKKLKFSH